MAEISASIGVRPKHALGLAALGAFPAMRAHRAVALQTGNGVTVGGGRWTTNAVYDGIGLSGYDAVEAEVACNFELVTQMTGRKRA